MQYITNFILIFFLLLMIQCSSCYMFFGLNSPVIKNSEFTSISSFGEFLISNSLLFLSCLTDQAIQYCLAPDVCIVYTDSLDVVYVSVIIIKVKYNYHKIFSQNPLRHFAKSFITLTIFYVEDCHTTTR